MFTRRIAFNLAGLLICLASATTGCKKDASTDLSTPKASATAFAKAMRAGDTVAMRAASVGTDEQFKVVESMATLTKAVADLKAAAVAKYGAENAKAFQMFGDSDVVAQVEKSEFKVEGDVATMVRKDQPTAKDPMKLKKVDGNWKVDLSAIPIQDTTEFTKMAPTMKQVATEVTNDINAGKYATAADAQKAMMTKMAATMMPSAPTPPAP